MGKWLHRLTNINSEKRTANCSECGLVRIKRKGSGYRCAVAQSKWHIASGKRDFSYLVYKKEYCEKCGFIAIVPEQLDVDHIDGNPMNSVLDNLMTLCANCHRLKTVRPDVFLLY